MSAFLLRLIFIVILLLTPKLTYAANTSSLTFDGSNDYVDVTHTTSLNVGNTLTVAAWIRPDTFGSFSSTTDRPAIYSTRNGNLTGSWQLELGDGSGGTSGEYRLVVSSPAVWNLETANNAIKIGVWQHVAFTKESASGPQKLYINGIEQFLITNNVATYQDNTNTKWIDRSFFGAVLYFPGRIDDVRLYKKALTKDQIAQAMHDNYSDGLVAQWKFDDNTGCSATDSMGNGSTGILSPTCSSSDSPTWNATVKAPLGVAGPNINDGVQSKGSGDYKFIGRTTVENSYIVDSVSYSINNSSERGVGSKDGAWNSASEEFEFNFRSDDNNPGYEGFLLDVRVTDSGSRESHRVHFEPFNLTAVKKLSDNTLQFTFNVHQNSNLMKDKLNEYQIGYTGSSISKTLLRGIPIPGEVNCSSCVYENADMKVEYSSNNSTIIVTTKNKFSEPAGKYTFKVVAHSRDNLAYESNGKTLDTTTTAVVIKTTKTSVKPATLGVTTTQPSVTPSASPKPTPPPYTPPEPQKPSGGFDLGQLFINFHLWLFSLLGLPVSQP